MSVNGFIMRKDYFKQKISHWSQVPFNVTINKQFIYKTFKKTLGQRFFFLKMRSSLISSK